MSSSVTVLVPLSGTSAELPSTLETVEDFLHRNGFAFTIRVLDRRDGDGRGAEILYGSNQQKNPWLARKLLTDLLPDPRVHLAAFSWPAARLLFAESKLA